MKAEPDSALLGASLAFAAAAVLGSAVAIHDQLPGEPLGVGIPLSVPAGLLAGWGAAVAAPWPMPVAAVMAAATARRQEPAIRPGLACAAIGLGCIAGTVIEPVTRRPRSLSPAARLAICVNLAASAALAGAGAWHAARARRQHREHRALASSRGSTSDRSLPRGPAPTANRGRWRTFLARLRVRVTDKGM